MIETNINAGILKMTSNLGFFLQEFYIRNKYGSGATISPKILRSEKKLTKDNVDSCGMKYAAKYQDSYCLASAFSLGLSLQTAIACR